MNLPTSRPWRFRPLAAAVTPSRARARRRTRRTSQPVLEALERRTVLSVTLAATNNGGNGYVGIDFAHSGGYTPPDTSGAAGPTSYVETVNQAVALYPKVNFAQPPTSPLITFWTTTGGLPRADGGSSLSDPVVAYNDQIGRFIIGDQDVNFSTHVSAFNLAVSKSSTPATLTTADWTFYQTKTTESGFDADYPGNFGYNHDAFVFTLNMFGVVGGGHSQVVSVSNADLAANVAPASLHVYQNDLNDFALRPTAMHDAVAGGPMWLVTEHGDGRSIDVVKETNLLSNTASFAYTNLAVAAYSATLSPLNPNGTFVTTNIDSRIENAAESKGLLVAAHSVAASATQDVAQWYAVDVSSGTPTLKDQGRVGAGNATYAIYPSIDINPSGQIGMTYTKSGNDTSTDYLSMYVTGRTPGDPAGTMETPVLVPAGTGQANYKDFSNGGRAGDLSGINVDPNDGSFWAANEFANTEATANWGTAVVNFTVGTTLPPADFSVTNTGPALIDVSAGATTATYTITIANNGPNTAQNVVLTDLLPDGSTLVSMTQTGGTDGFSFAQVGNKLTEMSGYIIAPGATDTFTLVVNAPGNLANGAAFNDTASISAANPDPNTGNNSATVAGSIVNTNPNADLSVTLTGPSSANEGASLTYTIVVTNNGPAAASGVVLTDTLPAALRFTSATTTQGTFAQSAAVVTFTIGALPSGQSVTAKVTTLAVLDGVSPVNVAVTSTSADPTPGNNTLSVALPINEPAIIVSGSVITSSRTLTNFKTATFTHASGVEPVGDFKATIDWGDGSTSTGTITQFGTTYTVTGSHTYSGGKNHTITTTVNEPGNAVDKRGDNPGAASPLDRDVVQLSDLAVKVDPWVQRIDHLLGTDPTVLSSYAAAIVRKRSAAGVIPLLDAWLAAITG